MFTEAESACAASRSLPYHLELRICRARRLLKPTDPRAEHGFVVCRLRHWLPSCVERGRVGPL